MAPSHFSDLNTKVTLTEKTSVTNQYEVDLPPPKAVLLIFMTTLFVYYHPIITGDEKDHIIL